MQQIWVVTCLATILIAGQASAADRTQKAETAEKKAGILEQNSGAKGSKTPPSRSEIITKTESQAVDPVGKEPLDDAITCLSRTIYWEAKREGAAGMEAIANVVMNRLGHKGFPNTICEVVRQGHERGACQFSWWCDGRSDDAKEDEPYSHLVSKGRDGRGGIGNIHSQAFGSGRPARSSTDGTSFKALATKPAFFLPIGWFP